MNLLIDVHTLDSLVNTGNCIVFDVRHDLLDHAAGLRAWSQGHVPGAVFLDHERDLCGAKTGLNGRHPLPTPSDFAGLMHRHGVRPGVPVVVYDGGNSAFAAHLWWMLRWIGHDTVAVLDGGWAAWLEAGLPVSTDAPASPVPGRLPDQPLPSAPAMPVVDATRVLANITTPDFVVLDARAANRFRGETEPMDPVAGHIPGALNRPNTLNCQPDGRFLPPQQLRQGFEALLGGQSPEKVVHQCGSGITACHNLFAMELAGLRGSALYPGSWSEWCADPSRPVATGG